MNVQRNKLTILSVAAMLTLALSLYIFLPSFASKNSVKPSSIGALRQYELLPRVGIGNLRQSEYLPRVGFGNFRQFESVQVANRAGVQARAMRTGIGYLRQLDALRLVGMGNLRKLDASRLVGMGDFRKAESRRLIGIGDLRRYEAQ